MALRNWKRLAFLLPSFCIAAHAAASIRTPYQITAYGEDLASLQILKNCLDYSVCQAVGTSIVSDVGEFRFHNTVSLNEEELQKVIGSCDPRRFPFKVTFVDLAAGRQIDLPPEVSMPDSTDRTPVEYPEMGHAQRELKLRVLESLLRDGVETNSISYGRMAFNIPFPGYQVEYSSEVDPSVATVDHETKQVMIGREWFTDACGVFRVLRHEAEHIHQMDHDRSCGGTTAFQHHVMRERSAYLNDILNIRQFCVGEERKLHELSASEGFSDYSTDVSGQ